MVVQRIFFVGKDDWFVWEWSEEYTNQTLQLFTLVPYKISAVAQREHAHLLLYAGIALVGCSLPGVIIQGTVRLYRRTRSQCRNCGQEPNNVGLATALETGEGIPSL